MLKDIAGWNALPVKTTPDIEFEPPLCGPPVAGVLHPPAMRYPGRICLKHVFRFAEATNPRLGRHFTERHWMLLGQAALPWRSKAHLAPWSRWAFSLSFYF